MSDALDQCSKRVNSDYLKECYELACEGISNGNLEKRIRLYVESTQKDMLPGIEVVILDIDNTLVKPKDHGFYDKYSHAVNAATGMYLGVSIEEGTRVADFYRQNFGGGEMALFSGNIGRFFPEYGQYEPNTEMLYELISSIDPSNQFEDDGISAKLINLLRSQGKRVVAITDSPEELSRKILTDAGIKPDDDFDLYLPYTRERGPLKILQREKVFSTVAEYFEIAPDRILSIGDTYKSDIEPAEKLGMRTCLVSLEESEDDYVGLKAKKFDEVFELYRRSL
jgi:FMN phosphatase YigB (HAD superfamily)